jgi:hypothetical protein
VVHTLNNQTMKLDALTREVVALGPIAAEIAQMKTRLTSLESTDNQQSGGLRVCMAILHSPVLMWIVVLAGIVWAYATGHLKP